MSIQEIHQIVDEYLGKAQTLHEYIQSLLQKTDITEKADTEFRPTSVQFNTSLSKTDRHTEGIYFTPKKVRDRLFQVLSSHLNPATILEPCFGTGEFLYDAKQHFPNARLQGVEKHTKLFQSVSIPNCQTANQDFRTYVADPVECVIGNPPYCVTKEKDAECMTGRGNLFVQFVYKCITKHLKPNGVLAMILPTSFLNCSYYEPCRNYIAKNTTILHLEILSNVGFYDTSQETILFVLKNEKPPSTTPYVFQMCGNHYFSAQYETLRSIVRNTMTLEALNFQVKTGEIVWNQHKDDLHDTHGTYLLYSSNIVNNTLCLNNMKPGEKKQRVRNQTNTPQRGPAILVNRGYGNSYKLQYAQVPDTVDFYGENHVNVITPKTEEAKNRMQQILQSFADPRTQQFITMFIGNGALSKTELETVLPIFV